MDGISIAQDGGDNQALEFGMAMETSTYQMFHNT
jgi:hypothetical protein